MRKLDTCRQSRDRSAAALPTALAGHGRSSHLLSSNKTYCTHFVYSFACVGQHDGKLAFMVLPTILSIVFRFVGFLRRGELSSMAAAWGSTSLSPCTSVLYKGLLMTACKTNFPILLADMTLPGLKRTALKEVETRHAIGMRLAAQICWWYAGYSRTNQMQMTCQ